MAGLRHEVNKSRKRCRRDADIRSAATAATAAAAAAAYRSVTIDANSDSSTLVMMHSNIKVFFKLYRAERKKIFRTNQRLSPLRVFLQ